jgi:DNA-binding response OmpR family regulator
MRALVSDCGKGVRAVPDSYRSAESPTGGAKTSSALPSGLRLLCVGRQEPSWVGLTLQLDAQGCLEPHFKWVSTTSEALSLLRDESFDCLLVRAENSTDSQSLRDALDLIQGIRAGGCDDPVVLVASQSADALWIEGLEWNADVLVTASGWDSPALVPTIRRAMDRGRLAHDNHHLAMADRRRMSRERDEADYLLSQQRLILTALERFVAEQSTLSEADGRAAPGDSGTIRATIPLPPEFEQYYQELLRTYVIMGAGDLAGEVAKLGDILGNAGFSPTEVLQLHLERVERLVRGLGNRSTRHVMARADLLALELMIHLGESYLRRIRGTAEPLSGNDAESGRHDPT